MVLPNNARAVAKEALSTNNRVNAETIYEKYCGTEKYEYTSLSPSGKAVYDEFNAYFDDAKSKINTQKTNTDIDAFVHDNFGDMLDSADGYLIDIIVSTNNESLATSVKSLKALLHSKSSFKAAVNAFKAEEWQKAASKFSQVSKDDSWYKEAQKYLSESEQNYLSAELDGINKKIDNGEYDEAEAALDSINTDGLSAENAKKIEDMKTKVYEGRLSVIDQYVDSGDFEAANEYIDSLEGELSEDAQERLQKAIKNKAADYIKKADTALKSGERQGAYDMALMAQNLCPDDDNIKKKIKYYKEYLPYALYVKENAISYSDDTYGNGAMYWNENLTSNNNKQMTHCLDFYYRYLDSGYSITYNLGKKYDRISGTAFYKQEYKNKNQKAHIKVYGDGKLLYTSHNITKNVMPKTISVDIKGVDVLKITFTASQTDEPDMILGYTWCGIAIANLQATKDLPK